MSQTWQTPWWPLGMASSNSTNAPHKHGVKLYNANLFESRVRTWRRSLKYRQKWPCTNKLREMESGFKECLPPRMKGFIIKRQAKLTPGQAKHPHFYTPTRELEADMMVDAPNRIDQTDALVEQFSVTQQM